MRGPNLWREKNIYLNWIKVLKRTLDVIVNNNMELCLFHLNRKERNNCDGLLLIIITIN